MNDILWTEETKQKINYTKLSRLLIDGGTQAVRDVFCSKIPPHLSLDDFLKNEEPNLLKLKKPMGRVLSNEQWALLYSPSGAELMEFDITLLLVLLTNVCGLKKPSTGWNALPPASDNSLEANLVRIKLYRNNVIAHSSRADVDDLDFEKYWKDISGILISLGLRQWDVDLLKNQPLGVDDYNQLLEKWYQSDEDIHSQLKRINQDTSENRSDAKIIKLDVQETKEVTKCIASDVAEIKNSLTSSCELDKLAHRDFSSHITKLCNSYHPNTREWLLRKMKSRVEKPSRYNAVVLQAGPGMGKSVIAAKLCQHYKEQGNLGACHLFKHDNSLHNNPRLMLQSISRQLCDFFPDYQVAVEKKLKSDLGQGISKLNCKELLTLLFLEPCSKLSSEFGIVIVIDALDECCNSWKQEFFEALNGVKDLPSWLKFIFTTRPPLGSSSINIGFTCVIEPDDKRNKDDLQMFLTDNLKELGHISSDHHEAQINHLVGVTEGLFLVASFVLDFLRNRDCGSLSEAIKLFPHGKGITSVYENYFTRLKNAIAPHIKSEEGFFNMLDAVVAAQYPIQKGIFYDILGLVDEPRVPDRERKEAIHLLHQLFPVENDHVSAFHKTVIDWLSSSDHDFSAKGDGIGVLANACYEVLNCLKQFGSKQLQAPPSLTEKEKHAMKFGGLYMNNPCFSEVRRTETQKSCLLFVFRLFYYRSLLKFYPFREDQVLFEVIEGYMHLRILHQLGNVISSISLNRFLETALQSMHLLDIASIIQLNPKPIDLLKQYGFPYQERQVVMRLPADVHQLLPYDKGFILSIFNENETMQVQKYALDGTLSMTKQFSGCKALKISPGNSFIIAYPVLTKGDIKIIDGSALTVHATFKAPNIVRTLCVYGSQPWYIVVRCLNNKIYVLDGETGKEMHQPVDIGQFDEVEAVSSQGHIVIGQTSLMLPMRHDKQNLFADEEGNIFEEMVWHKEDVGLPIFPSETAQCRKLFLCHFNKSHELIKTPIYPRQRTACLDSEDYGPFRYEPIKFSDDGQLLAFVYKNSLTVLDTANHSEHSTVPLCHGGPIHGILLLTRDLVIFYASTSLICYNFETKLNNEFIIYPSGHDGDRALRAYSVPNLEAGEIVFLSIATDLPNLRNAQSNTSVTDYFIRRYNLQEEDKKELYIYKHSLHGLTLEKGQ